MGAKTEPLKPTYEDLEIGSGNNKSGIIGRDFHFNANILAGSKIMNITLRIRQKPDKTYDKKWDGFEKKWPEHVGAKNAEVHSHFNIPADASEGVHDFFLIIEDENGQKIEHKADLTLVDPKNLPVDIEHDWIMWHNGKLLKSDIGEYVENANDVVFKRGDKLKFNGNIWGTRDDGTIYILLIKSIAKHTPETVADIDFSKAIVVSKRTHVGLPGGSWFRSREGALGNLTGGEITIGATMDNNPEANSIDGAKSWETGTYQLVSVYTNSTHKLSSFKSTLIKVQID